MFLTSSASAETPLEVSEEDCGGLGGGVLLPGPAEEWSAGQGQARAAVHGERAGALGVLLQQRVVAQVAVLVPAGRLLAARGQGRQGQPQA